MKGEFEEDDKSKSPDLFMRRKGEHFAALLRFFFSKENLFKIPPSETITQLATCPAYRRSSWDKLDLPLSSIENN